MFEERDPGPHVSRAAGLLQRFLSPLTAIRIISKRSVQIVSIWSVIAVAGILTAWLLPATYRSEAVILIESQRIPERFVATNVNADLQARLNTISQFVLSYSRLTEIVKKFDLYRTERQRLYQEEVIELMRNSIEIKPVRDWNVRASAAGPRAFKISFEGEDPAVVARVTTQICTLFIDENVKVREDQASSTSEFLENQLKDSKQALERQEAALSEFKRRYNGELPQQENVLIANLSQLQSQLDGVQDAIGRAEQQRFLLSSSLDTAQATQAAVAQFASDNGPRDQGGVSADRRRVQERKATLSDQLLILRQRYTAEHPDIARLTNQLEILDREEQRQSTKPDGGEDKASDGGAVKSPGLVQAILRERERVEALRMQIAANEKWLAGLQLERAALAERLEDHRGRIAKLPVREQQLAAVTREYDISNRNYQSLLDKKISAAMGTEMERRQQSERFTILDPARVPEKPVRPNRALIGGLISVIGLVLSLAIAFLLESRTNTIVGEWELPAGVVILGRVPQYAGPNHSRWRIFKGRSRSASDSPLQATPLTSVHREDRAG